MSAFANKQPAAGTVVKLLGHTRVDRGMTLMEEQSRCVRRGEIHEIVTTDQEGLAAGSRVDRVGFLGFAEFTEPGVVEVGDEVVLGARTIGRVVGFDACHFPNHYNILIRTERLLASGDIDLRVGEAIRIATPADVAWMRGEGPVSLILGCGRAGLGLHLPCLARAMQTTRTVPGSAIGQVFLHDPLLRRPDVAARPGAHRTIDRVEEIPEAWRAEAVVHVCTPPSARASVLRDCLEAGYRRFILEKPMVHDAASLELLKVLRAEYQPDVLVVSNWLSSELTDELRRRIARRADGESFVSMEMRQSKSRVLLSSGNASHASAIDVEIPHMVALALALGGPDARLADAQCWHMEVGEIRVPAMGGARLMLEWSPSRWAALHSDLMAPRIERTVTLTFADGTRLEGHYPCGTSDLHSQLFELDADGTPTDHAFFHDDTLTRFLREAYEHFLAGGPRPKSDLDWHLPVCGLLNQARESAVPSARPPFAELAVLPATPVRSA